LLCTVELYIVKLEHISWNSSKMIRLFTAKALPVITLKPSRLKQLSMEVKCVRSIPSKPLARGWSVLGATLQGLQPWSSTIYRSSENHLWKSRHGKSAEDEWWKNEKAKRAYFTFYYHLHLSCLHSPAPSHFYTFASIPCPPCSGFKPSDLNPNTNIEHNMRIYHVTFAFLI
jgi:hypothetical protein